MGTDSASVMTKNLSNGRAAFRACEDQGIYYINRVMTGLHSEVNLKFIRGADGAITDVYTSVNGAALYSLNMIGTPNIYSMRSFCIDYTATFGIQIDGVAIPMLGWQSAMYLRVDIDGEGGCSGHTTVGYGHCS
jgi:hypothetical protein